MENNLVLTLSFRDVSSASSSSFQDVVIPPAVTVATWGYSDLDVDEDTRASSSKKPLWGVILGCIDGSVFIFHPDYTRSSKRKSLYANERVTTGNESIHVSSRRPVHLSLPHSRATSPSASRTSLSAITSSKSRAVSGLSKEQAEAPKNYVDFEDEQERMKEMIGDISPRERYSFDGPKILAEKILGAEKTTTPLSLKPQMTVEANRHTDDARSMLSIESSPSVTPPVLSPPLSPSLRSFPRAIPSQPKYLSLKGRIFPSCIGMRRSVADLKVLGEGELFLLLQESGQLSLFKTIDGICVASIEAGPLTSGSKSTATSLGNHSTSSQMLWSWKSLHLFQFNDLMIVMAVAEEETLMTELDSDADDRTRITLFELSSFREYELCNTSLTKIVDFVWNGPANGVVPYRDPDGTLKLCQMDNSGHITMRSLGTYNTSMYQPPTDHNLSHIVPFPQPLRDLMSRSALKTPSNEEIKRIPSPRLDIVSESDAGVLPLTGDVIGLRVDLASGNLIGGVWTQDRLVIFVLESTGLKLRYIIPIHSSIQDIDLSVENSLRVLFRDKIETYAVSSSSQSKDDITNESNSPIMIAKLISTTAIRRTELSKRVEDSFHVLCLRRNEDNCPILEIQRDLMTTSSTKSTLILWSLPPLQTKTTPLRVTSLLPVESSTFIAGYSDGSMRSLSSRELISNEVRATSDTHERLDVIISSLFIVTNKRTGQPVVVGGGDDGSINFWDYSSLHLHARWIIFTEPLCQVIEPDIENAGWLQGCCICVSGDGTLAVIVIDGPQFIYLIPGSPTRLVQLSFSADNLMTSYDDGCTRLWDAKSREFRWSMSLERSSELLSQGGWSSVEIENHRVRPPKIMISVLNKYSVDESPLPIVLMNMTAYIEDLSQRLSGKSGDQTALESLKVALIALTTPGIDDQIDRSMLELVGKTRPGLAVGIFDTHSACHSYFSASTLGVWQISPEVSAIRLLSIAALLLVMGNIKEFQPFSEALLSLYSTSLPLHLGSAYQSPSLATLVSHWTESPVSEIRFAARSLFEAEVSRLPDDDLIFLVEKWQHQLPCVVPDTDKRSTRSALALSLCGNIAIIKYNLLSANTLTDIAKSITIHLYDETSPYRTLAIDICSRGFEIWQSYFDAMAALRSLFTLATTSRKESISVRNPGPQARAAVLQIASSNSPLFMTTLSLDILHPRSTEYSKSILQIVAFLIRKKPMVLYPSLPRLMEAVVKSLDPSSNNDREAVLDAVTDIIALVVQTFPTVDFHSGSQRLAVGTSEGAVILYDLKTATRLYVLERHRQQLSGISFSPDGRRLVTVSVEESIVLVWKVGSSFTSFFHPGAPPRQGHSGSDPFKTLSFKLMDGTKLSLEGPGMFSQIRFEWPSDRSVKVKVFETMFTFST